MTGPDRIWVNWKPADDEHPPSVVGAATVYSHINTMAYPVEYVRRDPAVIAALPEVQALIAAAYEAAAKALDRVANNWDCGHMASRLCDCAPLAEQWGIAAEEVRFLTPADATAALAARDAAMLARGMREAAGIDWTSGRDVSDTAPNYLSDWQRGLVAGQNAMRDAILARAAEIEGDARITCTGQQSPIE